MEKEQTEVEQRSRNRLAADHKMLLDQVPSTRANHQRRDRRIQLVCFAFRTRVLDGAPHRIAHVHLARDVVVPSGGVGILEIRHEHVGAGIQGVDHHLAVHRTRDLDAAVHQVLRNRRDSVVALTDRFGFGQEIGQLATVDGLLPAHALVQQFLPPSIELVV